MTEMVGLTCRVGAHNSRYAHDTRLYPICVRKKQLASNSIFINDQGNANTSQTSMH